VKLTGILARALRPGADPDPRRNIAKNRRALESVQGKA
jgi:hypothetical protein